MSKKIRQQRRQTPDAPKMILAIGEKRAQLLVQILYMEEQFRHHRFSVDIKGIPFTIESSAHPELYSYIFYVRGANIDKDKIVCKRYIGDDLEVQNRYIEKLTDALEEWSVWMEKEFSKFPSRKEVQKLTDEPTFNYTEIITVY